MPTIIQKKDIAELIKDIDVISAMEASFRIYSEGKTVVPPVGELLFDDPKGETHIKYGYIEQDDFYVIKIASGFYDNPSIGLSTSQGLMLLFSQQTGQTVAILLDEGLLTAIRTAAAGAVAARYFAPKAVQAIGIIGSGIQARLQLEYLQKICPCQQVWLWGRNPSKVQTFKEEIQDQYAVSIADSPQQIAQQCNLIVTTTPTHSPLLEAEDIHPGTHITAVGSDTREKQELSAGLLAKADLVIADSLSQSQSRGEVYQAIKAGQLSKERVIELGAALQDQAMQRQTEEQISVVDLTGVAVQDMMIAKAVYWAHKKTSSL